MWQYFAEGEAHYGVPWPLAYALPDEERLAILERLGVRAFPTLPYPHKAGMAAWLNDWSAEFAAAHPQVLQSATFYPEPEAPFYVAEALERGARIFKVHVQVGRLRPAARSCSTRCGPGWRRPARRWSSTAARARCAGEHTGPAPVTGLLERYPRLQLVIAHLGMPEYRDFLELAERYERVHLDTTMFATDFTERLMPFDPRRPAAPGRAAGQGAARQRLPVDPVPLRAPAAGAAPAGAGGGLAARRAVAQRRPAVQDRGVTPSFR